MAGFRAKGCDMSLVLMQHHSWINIFLETLQINSELIPYISSIHKTLHITSTYVTTTALWNCKVKKVTNFFSIFF